MCTGENAEALTACRVHLEWIEKERQGPRYPEGITRDNGGEQIWRAWWEEQLWLCEETERLTRLAVAKAEARLTPNSTLTPTTRSLER